MTLAEVAAQRRASARSFSPSPAGIAAANAMVATVEQFEADPDFKLRERVERLLSENGPVDPSIVPDEAYVVYWRDLERVLNPPKEKQS